MIEIRKCDFYRNIGLLKIKGKVFAEKIKEIKVYINNQYIGEMFVGTYIFDVDNRRGDKELNLFFSRVIECTEPFQIRIIGYLINDELTEICINDVQVIDSVPKEYVSTIGSKNGITVNGGDKWEREFISKVIDKDFLTPMTLLHIEISSRCNLECRYCIVSNGYNLIERDLISDEVLDRAIQGINELKTIKNVQISGLGEPTLNPRLADICRRIYEETYVRNVQFFTNGMLFDEKLSDALADIPLNFKITFSLDGHSPEENNYYRKGSDYEKVKKNILYFLKKISNKDNFWIRIHNLQINPLNDNDIIPPKYLLNDFGNLQIDSHRAFTFPGLSRQKLFENKIAVYEWPNKRICKRTFSECTVRHNGDIIRCHWDSRCEEVMGNILENSLKEIWYGEEYINQRKLMMPEVEFSELPEVCQRCHAMNEGFLYKEED